MLVMHCADERRASIRPAERRIEPGCIPAFGVAHAKRVWDVQPIREFQRSGRRLLPDQEHSVSGGAATTGSARCRHGHAEPDSCGIWLPERQRRAPRASRYRLSADHVSRFRDRHILSCRRPELLGRIEPRIPERDPFGVGRSAISALDSVITAHAPGPRGGARSQSIHPARIPPGRARGSRPMTWHSVSQAKWRRKL